MHVSLSLSFDSFANGLQGKLTKSVEAKEYITYIQHIIFKIQNVQLKK